MTREEKIKAIFSKHTINEQYDKLWEEFKELNIEICNFFNNMGYESNILTEVADVIHLCLQFLYAAGYSTEDLIKELDFKINRQCKRDDISG